MHTITQDVCLPLTINLGVLHPKKKKNFTSQISLEAIALAELASYTEEGAGQTVSKLSGLSIFTLLDFSNSERTFSERVNSTRLKERLLAQLPDLCEYSDGKGVRLAFSSDFSKALKFARDFDYDSEAIDLAKAATCRKELLTKQRTFIFVFSAPNSS